MTSVRTRPGTLARTLLTDPLYRSLVGVGLVLVVAVAYLFGGVLDRPVTGRSPSITVQMPAPGGLFEGSAVTYRGVKVGRVTSIELTEDGTVRAVARLDDPGGIPADSRVRVRSLSPVGEQYLDFQPRSDPGPFLRDGDVVQASVRDLPTSLGATVVAVSDLLDQVDDRALGRVLREVSTGVAGTGQELGRLIDQTDLLLAELDRALPTAESLLRDAGPAASLVVDQRSDLLQLGRSARRAAAFLKSYDPRLRELLAGAPERLEQIDGLVDQARAVLPAFLMAGVDLGRVLERYDPHLRQLLREYAPGLGTVGEVVGESLRVDLVVDQSTRCRYDTERRAPRDIAPRGLQAGGRCPESAPGLQRGAAHAPPPAR